MMLRALVIVFGAAALLLPVPAGAQILGGGPPLFTERLEAANGECVIITTGPDGRERLELCDYDRALDEFSDAKWDDFCLRWGSELSAEQYQRYCGPPDDAFYWEPFEGGGIAVSNVQIALNGHVDLHAPYLQGWLATEEPVNTLLNPAISRDLTYRGGGFRLDLDAQVGLRGFAPIDVTGGIDFTSTSASASAENLSFPNGLGVTGVGETPGVYINSPTDVLNFDLTSVRTAIAMKKMLGLPIFSGSYELTESAPPAEYVVLARVIARGGFINQTDTARFDTSTPAFGGNAASSIAYDTTFVDRFFGASVGLGVESTMPLGPRQGSSQPLTLSKSLGVAVGFDQHHVAVRDSVDAVGLGGALNYQSTKDLTYALAIPTASLDAKVGLGNGKWEASLGGGVSVGDNPGFEYSRPDSDVSGPLDPQLRLNWGVKYRVEAGFNVGF